MHPLKSWSAALAILLLAAACRTSAPATLPAVVVGPQEVEDGIAPTTYHGIPGLFIELDTWRSMLVQIERDKGALSVALARSLAAEEIAKDETKLLRESHARNIWVATYGPWLGFAGGITVAGVVAAILGGLLRR